MIRANVDNALFLIILNNKLKEIQITIYFLSRNL